MPNINYVKFQRGTLKAYNSQVNRNLIDNNTLYFVYESAAATSGQLYLGKKLISGVGSGTSVTKLSDLTDVIATTAENGSFLVCNADGKWEATTLNDVATLIASQLQINVNTNTFEFVDVDGQNPELNLLGFNSATSGSYAKVGTDGKLKWIKPDKDFDVIAQEVGELQTTIEGLDTVIANKIAQANHLTYKKVASLDDIKEVNTIYLVPKEGSENDAYTEYMFIDSKVEHLGTFNNGDLSGYVTTEQLQAVDGKFQNYVTKTVFNTTVGNLDELSNYTEGTTIVNEINNIYDRLVWKEIETVS